ncbi:hypothetical protein LJC68_07925 [Bacteroidales bacterium OttesenSCG-928-B11]|nr:hypothetical protein [Bacteroidales bacterium OttesenSCG-928-C03]MDL2312787.1 hypothetical protein [Bacteroidales bacterium OttesenSCG-928-B11]MDL2325871.1 hypothetical protein [Bacteroidales bacterium OttesenSCG-928-A14]
MAFYINKKTASTGILTIAAIFCLLLTFNFCKKKLTPQETLENNIRQAAREFIPSNNIDSIYIQEIDTISSLGYAILMKGVLTDMLANYEYEYKAAIFEDNEMALMEIELSMTEIEYMLEYFTLLIDNGDLSLNDALLICVLAEFESDGHRQSFDMFTSIDGHLHVLDPFNDNLLDEKFAAE